jgi:cellulose synthase/poly-beta-1,6-N-acetylglucosamine synthase-like glycosyltransferase
MVGMKYSYLGNVWSAFMVQMAYGGAEVNGVQLSFGSTVFLKVFSPYQGTLVTLCFQIAYAFVLCMLMMLLSMKYNRGIGITVSIVIHALGSDIIEQGLGGNPFLSPLLRSLPAYHRIMPHEVTMLPLPTLMQSGILWVSLMAGLVIAALLLSRRYDFSIPNQQV